MPAWRPAWRPPNSRPPRQSATSSGHPFFKLRALLCDRQVPQRQPTRTRRAQSRTPAWRMLKSRRSRRAAAAAASCAPRTCRRRRRCPRGRCPRRMPRSGSGCPPCVLPEGRRQFCALLCSMQDHRRVGRSGSGGWSRTELAQVVFATRTQRKGASGSRLARCVRAVAPAPPGPVESQADKTPQSSNRSRPAPAAVSPLCRLQPEKRLCVFYMCLLCGLRRDALSRFVRGHGVCCDGPGAAVALRAQQRSASLRPM